jgi:hypothetical protein
MTVPPPRSRAQRRADTLTKLETEVDLWVASADEAGVAYLVPLSFHWDGEALTLATATRSRTGRNLLRAGWARVALGPTRDVVMIEGPLGGDPGRHRPGARERLCPLGGLGSVPSPANTSTCA